jgi:hypothetical protein
MYGSFEIVEHGTSIQEQFKNGNSQKNQLPS